MADTPPNAPPVVPPVTPPETPTWAKDIPEKFRKATPEETLAAINTSYTELEKKLGAPKPPEPPPANAPLKIESPTITGDEDVPVIVAKAGLKLEDLESQYKESGELTPEQYAAFRKVNPALGKAVINELAAGMVAKAALRDQTIGTIKAEAAKLAGGEAALAGLLSQAHVFVPADEIDDINKRLADPKAYKGAIRDLMDFHKQAVGAGKTAALAQGQTPTSSGAIKTSAEFAQAVRLAERGDAGAIARINATPQATIDSWRK